MATDSSLATRMRLLDAARHVFAARGYELATVRDITERAGANQAAINYHFGSKAALYGETIDLALQEVFLPLDVPTTGTNRATLLHALVSDIVGGSLRAERPPTHLRLLAIEILRPTGTLRLVIREALATRAQRLGRSLAQLRDPGETDEGALLLAHWLLGSCLVALQLAPDSAYGTSASATKEQGLLVERLTRLVSEGIAGTGA